MGIADSGTLHHVAFVVNDLEKTARSLASSLGIKPWDVWTIEPEECTVRGKSTPFTLRIALAPVGASNYELIEPVSGDSVYVEHLQAVGEGFHHSCIAYQTRAAMQAAKAELLGQGREIIQSGSLGDNGAFYYFEIAEASTVLELLYLKELPPPEMTIS